MNQVAKFFTIYWCIYFPFGIAFNEMSQFSSVDEVLTGIIILYTFAQKGRMYVNNKPWKEYSTFWALLVFYIIYSLILQVNVANAVWYDLMQQIRPWSVIYCTWILNPQFSEKQKKWMLRVMVGSLIAFLVYNPGTAANAFGGSNRNAQFGQLAISTSMAWFLFTKQTKKNMYIATAIAVVGLLGMKFKYYGQFGAWMFVLYYLKEKLTWKKSSTFMRLGLLFFIVLMLGWERFNAYYVEGADNEILARPMMNKVTWQMLWDYFPFGSGLGTYGTAASAVYYSPVWAQYGLDKVWGLGQYGAYGHGVLGFHGDNFFATFGQIGVFGLLMFIIFWKRRFQDIYRIGDIRYYKVALMCFFCIAIEWFGDSSFLSGRGMGFLMLLGLCLNMARPRNRRVILNNTEGDEGVSNISNNC